MNLILQVFLRLNQLAFRFFSSDLFVILLS